MRLPSTDALALPLVRRAAVGTIVCLMAAYTAVVVLQDGGTLTIVIYDALMASGALVCLARVAAIRTDRLAWGLIGLGLGAWAAADASWTLFFAGMEEPPYPSVCDVGWLAIYPCTYAGVLLLLRSRRRALPAGLWLDGGIAAFGATALVAAVVLEPVLAGAVEGATAAVATNLAYPVGDLLLLGVVMWAFACTGWRPDRQWLLLAAGILASSAGDTWYLASLAHGSYVADGFNDMLWPLSSLLMGWAAWQPAHRGEPRADGLRMVLVPATFSLVALGLLVFDHVQRLHHLAIVMATVTMSLAVVRMGVTFLANARMLRVSRRQAITDALTGLGNRRRLTEDLEASMDPGDGAPQLLVLFDLDGFKRYNDTFGHPAGDALLMRLGARLEQAIGTHGRAYRMGGDEFCVLLRGTRDEQEPLVSAAADALRESGRGFTVGVSFGSVRPALDATTAAEALQIADQRMYGHKASRSAGRTSETRDVLMRILHEREPGLHEHITSVAQLANAVGARLGLTAHALDELTRAAELHDIGKMAIPDTILTKPGPLDDAEWAFMRRHTVIGEAILSAAPGLVPIARIVRASHERFDGKGYPDGLAGAEIPIAARIVAVCDAYDAMISDRSYRRGMGPSTALAELRDGAGTQFDRAVVEAFCVVQPELVSAALEVVTSTSG